MELPFAGGCGFGRFHTLDDDFDVPATAARRQNGSRGNAAQIDAVPAADVRWRDSVALDIHPADIVRPRQIQITSACFATPDSAVYRTSRLGVRAW
jgi:hypothetical protein